VKKSLVALGLALAATAAADAVPNPGIRYPDNSIRYAVGYPNFDWPVVSVARGESCTVVIEPGEDLIVKDNVPVIVADRTRWTAVGSRSGGQLVNGRHVPTTWSVTVQPANDADDTWLTIVTGLGRRYMVHLVAVDRHSRYAQQLVGFYLWHPPQKRRIAPRRQEVALRRRATAAVAIPTPSPSPAARRQHRFL
jgi:hypothetical protein